MVMLGHLYHRGFDAEYPASLSRKIIEGRLRGSLGFDGVVITDDMQMRGITRQYGFMDGIVKAFAAGVDMVIIGNNLEYDEGILGKVVDRLLRSVDEGILHEEKLQASFDRIQQPKEVYL